MGNGGDRGPRTSATARRGSPLALSVGAIGAAVLGVQCLAASTPARSDVLLLLPSQGLLAGVGDGLRRGYALAMAEAGACGVGIPSLRLGWMTPGQDPRTALEGRRPPDLLIAPPAVALLPYGLLAQQSGLSVLLPLQRGSSLQSLPSQPGSDRIWAVLPARTLEADALARGLIAERRAKVMVVQDGTGEQAALAERMINTLGSAGGWVVGPSDQAASIPEPDDKALKQLIDDVEWFKPEALAVMTTPSSPLAKAIAATPLPIDITLVWPFPVESPGANPQLGVDPLSRGPAWEPFAKAFQARFGYAPGLVEASGYDTGLLVAVTSAAKERQRPWDLQWLDPKATPQKLCPALKARKSGSRLAIKGAASKLDLVPGIPPTAELRLTPVKAGDSAPPS